MRGNISPLVMPGLEPGIHDFLAGGAKDVDARDKRGHDELRFVCRNAAAEVNPGWHFFQQS